MKTRTKNLMLIYTLCCVFLAISGCTYYKSFTMKTIHQESVSVIMKHKGVILVNDLANNNFLLESKSISSLGLTGNLLNFSAVGHSRHMDRLFRNKHNKNEQYDPTTVMHIYYRGNLQAENDYTIEFDKIESVEVHEKAPGANAMIPIVTSIGVTAGVFTTVGVIAILFSGCACPMVETSNATETQFHGSLFPGSIFKSLKRTDYLELGNFKKDSNSYVNFKIFNNMPEIEYIDQIRVLELDDKNYEKVSALGQNTFVGFNVTQTPKWAVNDCNDTLTQSISKHDDIIFEFDQVIEGSEINTMVVSFDKGNLSKKPILSLVAKQSRWLEEVALFNFNMIGNKHEAWVEKMDKANPADWYDGQIKSGVALAVYIKNGTEWELIGNFTNPGTLAFRDLILPVDLSTHTGDEIELKFTSAYKLWDIDQVALSDEYNTQLQGIYLNTGAMYNHNSEEISSLLAEVDENYLVQPQKGDFFTFKVKTLGQKRLFLEGTGYYHIQVENEEGPNLAYLKQLKSKGGIHRISKDLEYYRAMVVEN